MALSVNTNNASLNAISAASTANKTLEQAMARLSTGKRINTASDDAAGMAIASRLTSEIKGTNQAIRNAMDGQALIDTAEGAHQEVGNILQRMRELSVQAASDTNSTEDRVNLQLEVSALSTEIDRIAQSTTWAGKSILNGTADKNSLASGANATATWSFQIGSGTSSGERIETSITALTSSALGVSGTSTAPSLSAEYVGVTGEGKMEADANTNTITFSGKFNAGDVYSLDIASETVSITATTGDGFSDDATGLAAQMAAAIRTLSNTGTNMADAMSVVDNGDGSLTVTTKPVFADVTTTETAAALADDQTFVYDTAADTFTVGGTYESGDSYSFSINGTAVSLTTDSSTNLEYEASNEGVAAQLVDQINATSALTDGGVRAFLDADDATSFRVVQDVVFESNTYTPQTTSTSGTFTGAEVSGASTLTFANTPEVGEVYSSKINGVEVSMTVEANDGYDLTATGSALKFKDAVQAKIDSGELKGITVDNSAGVITLTQDSTITEFENLTLVDVGSTTTMFASYASATGILSIDSGTAIDTGAAGDHENGDTVSFSINGVDISVTIDTTDGFHDTSDGLSQQVAAAINENAELKAMGITATQTKMAATPTSALVTLAFTPQLENTSVTSTPDMTIVTSDSTMSSTLTMNRSSFSHGDTLSLDVDGTAIEVTISTADSSADTTIGVAGQLKAAIDAAGINGVTVVDNGDGSLEISKPSTANVTSAAAALSSIDVIDAALVTLNTQRAALGAISNRLDHTVSNLTNMVTNLESSRGRVEDADFAVESGAMAKAQILSQASTAMLAQANASKQGVLQLLQR